MSLLTLTSPGLTSRGLLRLSQLLFTVTAPVSFILPSMSFHFPQLGLCHSLFSSETDRDDVFLLVSSARPLRWTRILWHHIWSHSLYYWNLLATSSLICQMFTLRSAQRGHISGNILFRYPIWCWRLLFCSLAKKTVFGCMLSIRNRRECPSSSSGLSFCTHAVMLNFFFPCAVNPQECLTGIAEKAG